MRDLLRSATTAVLGRESVTVALLRRRTSRLAVLAYHGVDDPALFERHLQLLTRHARPVGLAQVEGWLQGGPELPPGATLVTFDDGDVSVLRHGLPLLEAYDVPAVAFLVTDLLDTAQPCWWVEVAELAGRGGVVAGLPSAPGDLVAALKRVDDADRRAALAGLRVQVGGAAVRQPQLTRADVAALQRGGVTIGNHTATHPCLDRCTDDVVEAEIGRAHEALTAVLGHEPATFAYPNGNHSATADRVLAGLGYRTAFLFDHALTARTQPPRALSRLRVNSTDDIQTFRAVVSGAHPALHAVRARVARRPRRRPAAATVSR